MLEGARRIKESVFGKKIFLYGFVYLSTYCRNNCSFCHYRSELTGLDRYRKGLEAVAKAAKELASSGAHLIDLTMGEDARYLSGEGFDDLLEIVRSVRRDASLPIMLSPGLLSKAQLRAAKEAGADWYALYQETYNRSLFRLWRRGQSFDERLEAKKEALAAGLLVEEGLLTNAGASASDLAEAIVEMRALPASPARAMTYVPSPGGRPPASQSHDSFEELLTIAALRLSLPEALIPASLDVEGQSGLMSRVMAGANVATSLVPAGSGLAGVASKELDIDNHCREPLAVSQKLLEAGFEVASREDYLSHLETARAKVLEGSKGSLGAAPGKAPGGAARAQFRGS